MDGNGKDLKILQLQYCHIPAGLSLVEGPWEARCCVFVKHSKLQFHYIVLTLQTITTTASNELLQINW